jgi:proteasome accessory factor C
MALLSSGVGPPALASAVAKLQSVVVEDPGAVEIDIPTEPTLVGLLRDAAAAGRAVEITHVSLAAGRTTVRTIEPWSVFSTGGNWYVSGFCRMAGAERVFRIDRIRSAQATDDHFTPPESPPPPEVGYTPGVDDVQATIRLRPGAEWVADYYPVEIVSEDEDGRTVVFSAADPAVAARLLLRLGDGAELLEGSEVADRLTDLRRRVLGRYR